MFDPPAHHYMRELDRNAFQKEFPLAAIRVSENRFVTQCRNELGDSLLVCDRLSNVRSDPNELDSKGAKKVVLLHPKIKAEGWLSVERLPKDQCCEAKATQTLQHGPSPFISSKARTSATSCHIDCK